MSSRWTEADLAELRTRLGGKVVNDPVRLIPPASKKAKFQNIPCEIDGIKFDSRTEGRRYKDLKLFALAGELSNLELQPKFPLVVNGELVCTYIADFSYQQRGHRVVEDVKSKATKTPQYRIKVKLLRALMGIEVREVA